MIFANNNYKTAQIGLKSSTAWVIDVETNGLNPYGANQICGLGICSYDGESSFNYYFPFRHQQGENLTEAARQEEQEQRGDPDLCEGEVPLGAVAHQVGRPASEDHFQGGAQHHRVPDRVSRPGHRASPPARAAGRGQRHRDA